MLILFRRDVTGEADAARRAAPPSDIQRSWLLLSSKLTISVIRRSDISDASEITSSLRHSWHSPQRDFLHCWKVPWEVTWMASSPRMVDSWTPTLFSQHRQCRRQDIKSSDLKKASLIQPEVSFQGLLPSFFLKSSSFLFSPNSGISYRCSSSSAGC